MLAMSPLCPTLGWEYSIELESNKTLFDNFDFDSMFLPTTTTNNNNNNFSSSNNNNNNDDNDNDDDNGGKEQQQERSESPQGTISCSSTDHHQLGNGNNNNKKEASLSLSLSLSKKLNHNASERDRRKKINNMYSSLRALLPLSDQRKKLSIPATVGRVLEYIPELQKEVDDLTHKKNVFLKKLSALQGRLIIQEDNNNNNNNNNAKIKNYGLVNNNETTSCSISLNKLGDQEMVIQLSAFQRIISLADVLLLLENNGFLVIDVSSFQSFGGTTFYNLHLWMEGRNNVDYEKLNEMLHCLLQKQKHMQMYS